MRKTKPLASHINLITAKWPSPAARDRIRTSLQHTTTFFQVVMRWSLQTVTRNPRCEQPSNRGLFETHKQNEYDRKVPWSLLSSIKENSTATNPGLQSALERLFGMLLSNRLRGRRNHRCLPTQDSIRWPSKCKWKTMTFDAVLVAVFRLCSSSEIPRSSFLLHHHKVP